MGLTERRRRWRARAARRRPPPAARACAALACGSGTRAPAAPNAGDEPAAADVAARDALFAHLPDHRGDVAPIGSEERAQRRARLGGILSELGADAIAMESGATMTYLAAV